MSDTTNPIVQNPSPEQLAAFEAELKRLSEELDRFAQTRSASLKDLDRAELLALLRTKWAERQISSEGDAPESWKQEFDAQLSQSLNRILEEGLVDKPGGGVNFVLPKQTLAESTAPLLKKLLEGFAQSLSARFETEAAKPAAPANPFNSLLNNLGQAFAGALGNFASNIKVDGNSFSFSSPGGTFTTQKAKPAPSTTAEHGIASISDVETSSADTTSEDTVKADAKADADLQQSPPEVTSEATSESKTADTANDEATIKLPEVGQLFQQLISGLGGALRQSLGPNPGATVGQALSGLFSQAMQRAQTATEPPSSPADPSLSEEAPSEPLSEAEALAQAEAKLAAAEAELARTEQEAIDLFTKMAPKGDA